MVASDFPVPGLRASRTGLLSLRRVEWAIAASVVGIVVMRIWSSLTPQASAMRIQVGHDGPEVAWVAIGSHEWISGVRQGGAYTPWSDGGGQIVTEGGVEVIVPHLRPEIAADGAAIAVVLLVAAAALWSLLPLASRSLLLGSAAAALAGLVGAIWMPIALAVMLVPSVAALPVAWQCGGVPGRAATLALVGCVVGVALSTLLLYEEAAWQDLWTFAWLGPVVVASLVAGSVVTSLAWRMIRRGHLGSGPSTPVLVVAATELGRRAIRIATDEERGRSAQRLHDDVLPRVTAGLLAQESGDADVSTKIMRTLAADLRAGIDREQLTVLRSGGIQAALHTAVSAIEDLGVPCSLEARVEGERPPWEVELSTWRIAQQALANALMHASARTITVVTEVGSKMVALDVIDDGVGLELPLVIKGRPHLGLTEMRARAQETGGTLELLPNDPSGLRVRFRWSS